MSKENNDSKENIIKETGSVDIKNKKGNIHCLTIIGQVEGHDILPPQSKTTKYEHILPRLVSVEENGFNLGHFSETPET